MHSLTLQDLSREDMIKSVPEPSAAYGTLSKEPTGIIAVDSATFLVNAGHQTECVVREKSFLIEGSAE